MYAAITTARARAGSQTAGRSWPTLASGIVEHDRGEPRQCDGEAEHQHGGDHELGDAHADEADGRDEVVGPAVAVEAREDAEHDRTGDGEQDGDQGDQRGVAEVHGDLAADRLPGDQGGAEVAVQGAAHPFGVPLPGGPVEAQLLAQGGDGVRGGVLAEDLGGDVAGQGLDGEEDEDGGEEEGAEGGGHPAGHEGDHCSGSLQADAEVVELEAVLGVSAHLP